LRIIVAMREQEQPRLRVRVITPARLVAERVGHALAHHLSVRRVAAARQHVAVKIESLRYAALRVEGVEDATPVVVPVA